MDADLELLLAIIGTGVALAAILLTQSAARRRENVELRSEIGSLRDEMQRENAALRSELSALRERIARMEGVLDMIRSGMQLPRLATEPDPEHQAS